MGSVIISVDAELGWGFSDYEEPPPTRMDAGRSGWSELLDILEAHNVPATWAVVGHLLLNDPTAARTDNPSIAGRSEIKSRHWRDRPDLWFGADLVDEVINGDVDHEIGCHSFSHQLFGAPETTREVARVELSSAVEAAQSIAVEFESFVFPRNDVGHRDLLAEFGFRCYRSPAMNPKDPLRRTVGKLIDMSGRNPVTLATPTVDEYGLVNIPPSLFLFGFEGWPRHLTTTLWDDPVVSLAKRGIDHAGRENGIFHLWLHPNNIQTERDVSRVRRIVSYAADLREQTDLTIETMTDVAARVLDQDPHPVLVQFDH